MSLVNHVFPRAGLTGAIAVLLFLCAATGAVAGGNPELLEPTEGTDGFKVIELDEFTFAWQVRDDSLDVRISAPTTGWVALGFEPSRAMRDADMRIGFVADGSVEVEDHFGVSAINHRADSDLGGTSDVSDIGGSEEDGRTTLTFTTPLDSGDRYDAALTPGEEVIVIYAHGGDGVDDYTTKHVARGGFRVVL